MRILIVGFGNMGCRHTQSVISSFPESDLFVMEPNEEIFEQNRIKIGAVSARLNRIEHLRNIPDNIDFSVVATSSYPRYEIVKFLLERNIKKILVEKVVFQSKHQFESILKLAELKGAILYCNFVNRYFPNYQQIKFNLDSSPITMKVMGGDFGLACNGLHYVDLFKFFTGKNSTLSFYSMKENITENRRGSIYKEVVGQALWVTDTGDRLIISSDKEREGGVEVTIIQNESINILNEQTLEHIECIGKELQIKPFVILNTSYLTSVIIKDILKGTTTLPNLKETESYHTQFFQAINSTLGLDENDLCPIT